jgi:hypothetical protein
MSYEVYPIGWIIDSGYSPELLEQRLKEFCCSRDKQLESFIQNRAIFFETKGLSRTYLIFDTTATGSNKVPPIAAFFTLALTSTNFLGISKSKRAKVLGPKPGRNSFDAFGGILIAQLARDDRYGPAFIDGTTLLRECESYIELGRQYLGGRIIYLDCKKALIDKYRQSGYALLHDTAGSGGYFKMYKILPDKVSLLSAQ